MMMVDGTGWEGEGGYGPIGEVFDWATGEGCPLAATRGAIASSWREEFVIGNETCLLW